MICPAMHTEMWEQASIEENLDILADRGVLIVPPESGRLAGGDLGHGRLAKLDRRRCGRGALTDGDLAGRTVLVTAGGASRSTPCATSVTARPVSRGMP